MENKPNYQISATNSPTTSSANQLATSPANPPTNSPSNHHPTMANNSVDISPNTCCDLPAIRFEDRNNIDMSEYRRIWLPSLDAIRQMDSETFQAYLAELFKKGSPCASDTLRFLRLIEKSPSMTCDNMDWIINMAPLILCLFVEKYSPRGMVEFIFSLRKRYGSIPFNPCPLCDPLWEQW